MVCFKPDFVPGFALALEGVIDMPSGLFVLDLLPQPQGSFLSGLSQLVGVENIGLGLFFYILMRLLVVDL